ncbi:MAG: hypothetical protein HY901_06275 [Deltaproteobacteria bacterium]|nr:hypothetical protein [Deltaproteobacteria bacterium]
MNRAPAFLRLALALTLCAALTGCPADPVPGPDASVWLHDCASLEHASSNPECALPLTEERQSYLNTLDTVDWWVLDVPEPLPPRSLLTVVAQYKNITSTPVVLSVNVLQADGRTSLASGVDPRRASSSTAGGPGPAQAVGKLTAAGRYYVVVRHDVSADDAALDRKNPYTVRAQLDSDPDQNEPNETIAQATAIPLAACGGFAQKDGALSVSKDLDFFQFDVAPCAGGRTLLYVSIQAPASPGPQIRLNYELSGPAGVVATDFSDTPMKDQLVATSRLSAPGHYTLRVNAYRSTSDTVEPPGDTSFIYTVKVALFPDLDTNEGATGNDGSDTAKPTGLTPGQSATYTGRFAYVGDYDVYAVTAGAANSRLHYRFSYPTGTGAAAAQFPAIPTLAPKELTVFTVDKSAQCSTTCAGDPSFVGPWCTGKGQCLKQRRLEDATISALGNFEGTVYLPAGSGTWYVQVGFSGAEGADDQPYQLALDVRPGQEPHGESNPIVVNLDNPGAEGTTVLGWGHGGINRGAPNGLQALPRSPMDYDAETQREWFEFRFTPAVRAIPEGDGGTKDVADHRALRLQWSIGAAAGQVAGQRSHDVVLHFIFCKDAACTERQGVPGNNLGEYLGYSSGQTDPWYLGANDAGLAGMQKSFDFNQDTGTFKARDALCNCVDGYQGNVPEEEAFKSYAGSGVFKVVVEAIGRTSYADSTTRLQLALGSYPIHATDDAGKEFDCPVPCRWVNWYATH